MNRQTLLTNYKNSPTPHEGEEGLNSSRRGPSPSREDDWLARARLTLSAYPACISGTRAATDRSRTWYKIHLWRASASSTGGTRGTCACASKSATQSCKVVNMCRSASHSTSRVTSTVRRRVQSATILTSYFRNSSRCASEVPTNSSRWINLLSSSANSALQWTRRSRKILLRASTRNCDSGTGLETPWRNSRRKVDEVLEGIIDAPSRHIEIWDGFFERSQ